MNLILKNTEQNLQHTRDKCKVLRAFTEFTLNAFGDNYHIT